MKRINLYGILLFSATLIMNSGCTKDTLPTAPPTNTVPPTSTPPPTETVPPPVTVPPINTTEPPKPAPTAFAGEDFQLILPTNFCWLSGGYSNVGATDIDNVLWKKISGPSSYILENPNSIITKVSNLEKGIYEFELTITNKVGLTGKDTARITVGEMSVNQKELIFKDMAWICPMLCEIVIENIYSHLPAGTVFRIYIQRDDSANWEEVIWEYPVYDSSHQPSGLNTYILHNGHLYIYLYDYSQVEDTPNIKIVY